MSSPKNYTGITFMFPPRQARWNPALPMLVLPAREEETVKPSEKYQIKVDSDYDLEFRRNSFDSLILPERIKIPLVKMLQAREYDHLLFVGPAGIGKTITAAVLGSSAGVNIDVGETRRRTQISRWDPYYSYSFKDHWFVYLEDVHLQSKKLQADVSYAIDLGLSVSFIVAIREETNLSPILRSRLLRFDFTPLPEEQESLKSHARQRCSEFLSERGVQVTDEAIAEVVNTTFPNYRLMVDKLQQIELRTNTN